MINTEPTPTTQSSAPAPAIRQRVLLVDDEGAVRNVLKTWFTRRGWEAVEAVDGEQAREALSARAQQSFDVVVCDLRMPGLSGVELYEWLASENPSMLQRIILTSGDVHDVDIANFLADASCVVLEKPFELSSLTRVVERVQGRGRAA